MIVFWAVAAGVFLVLEAISAAMTTIWFCVGSLLSLAAAALGAPLWVQIVVFVAASALCFVFLYPRLKHLVRKNRQPTNADMVLGQTCIVTERISNLEACGAVMVCGKTWTARSSDGSVIEPDRTARVDAIDGVKLLVTEIKREAKQTVTI